MARQNDLRSNYLWEWPRFARIGNLVSPAVYDEPGFALLVVLQVGDADLVPSGGMQDLIGGDVIAWQEKNTSAVWIAENVRGLMPDGDLSTKLGSDRRGAKAGGFS